MKIALGADAVGKPLLDVIAAHLARRSDLTVTDLSGQAANVAAIDRLESCSDAN